MNNLPKNAVPVLMEKPEEKPKPVYINEIDDYSHIGFVTSRGKAYIVKPRPDEFAFIGLGCEYQINSMLAGGPNDSIKGIIDYVNDTLDGVSVFKFTTRHDLYAWLAED